MLQRLRQRFGTIRWKLTGTFVLVSLLLALTLITILVGAVLWIVNSNLILQALGDVALQEAKALVPEFESADRSPQRLGAQLRAITADLDRESRPQARGITGQLSGATPTTTPGDLQFNSQIVVAALLDSDGRVITTTMPSVYRSGALLADVAYDHRAVARDQWCDRGALCVDR